MRVRVFNISHKLGEDTGLSCTSLDDESTMNFLEEVADPYLYFVQELDGENEVEILNGEEWLYKHTEMRRCLKNTD